MKYALEVADLSVTYYGQTAVENVSFQTEGGEMIGIIGPNGAGKSTLIKAMLDMIPKNSGTVHILEKPINKVRRQIAYVPQRNTIDFDFPVLVEDVVLMGSYPHLPWWKRPGQKERDRAKECLAQVGMEAYVKRQIGELSGGQQQRVFLARALQQDGQILFLDEPFSGIDVSSEKIIIDLLFRLKNEGRTIFVVHHDLSKVEEYFNSILLLNQKVIGWGSREEVFQPELIRQAYEGNVAKIPGTDDMVVSG